LAFLERNSANTGMIVFGFSVVFVFLVLAALYESWALPLAVILVVPMCVLCSIAGVAFNHMDINIFTQVGFVVLIGLACKNAILIVEFAKARYMAGDDIRTATLDACRLRLRPILMTSCAFILGVVPLVLAEGAGAEMRQALGTAVFSGMIGVTLFGIFLTPVFFSVVEHVSHWHVFSTGWLPRIGQEALRVLRLEPVRRGIAYASRQLRRPAPPTRNNSPPPNAEPAMPAIATTQQVVLSSPSNIEEPSIVVIPSTTEQLCFAAHDAVASTEVAAAMPPAESTAAATD